MTNNKLTDETLNAWKTEAKISLGETAKDTPEYSHHAAIFELVTELQERRKAGATPEFHTEAARFLPECLKPEEISGEKRGDRIAELMGWFDRYYNGKANPKWFKSHTAELCYYILTAPQPVPDAEKKQCSHGALDNEDGVITCRSCGKEWDL